MTNLVKTAAFSVLLAAAALVGGAAPGGDQSPDAGGPALPPGATSADQPAPQPDLSAVSSAQPQSAQSADSSADESEADTEAAPRSEAAAKPAAPLKRPRYAIAVIQALDKVTAETIRFEAPIDKPIRYKTLIFTVHACETTAADESVSDAAAHVEIDSQPLGIPGKAPPPARRVFQGWMFAAAPGLNLFEHPVYDAWLIACKTPLPSA